MVGCIFAKWSVLLLLQTKSKIITPKNDEKHHRYHGYQSYYWKKNDKKHHRHHEVNKNFLLDNSNIKDLIYNANDFPIQLQY